MVEFAAVRFLDRLNRAATKVYASSRAIFSVAHFLASCLFQTDSSLAAAHCAAMKSLARYMFCFMFIAIATN